LSLFFKLNCEKLIFECNFDNSNDTYACGGSFTNTNLNKHKTGVFDNSNTIGTDLKYDLTDYSSICNFIFNFLRKKII